LKDGLIAEHHGNSDEMSMLMQLGLVPPAPFVSVPATPAAEIAHRNVTGTAEQKRNLETFTAYNDAMERGDLDAVAGFLADDARNHGRSSGREGVRAVLADIFRTYAFEGDGIKVVKLAAVDDTIVARLHLNYRHTGTSQLPIDGGLLMGKPPTGRMCSVQHIHWLTLHDGLIVEHRACRDDVSRMNQLGLMPPVTEKRA
jgi:predicted ester cyclase